MHKETDDEGKKTNSERISSFCVITCTHESTALNDAKVVFPPNSQHTISFGIQKMQKTQPLGCICKLISMVIQYQERCTHTIISVSVKCSTSFRPHFPSLCANMQKRTRNIHYRFSFLLYATGHTHILLLAVFICACFHSLFLLCLISHVKMCSSSLARMLCMLRFSKCRTFQMLLPIHSFALF